MPRLRHVGRLAGIQSPHARRPRRSAHGHGAQTGDIATAAEALTLDRDRSGRCPAHARPASANSTASSAAASCPARPSSSAASRASANPRCSCRWRTSSLEEATESNDKRKPALESVPCSLRHQRRIRPADQAPRRAARRRFEEPPRPRRDQCRADHQSDPQAQPGRRGDRFDPDDLQARPPRRAGLGHAASRLLHGSGLSRQDPAASRSSSSATSPRPARSRGRRSSSTSSIPSSTSRAIASTPIASSAASRTASAPRTKSACSK